ncbi:hypothetical protein DNTS_031717 [Danionella cerebrum]|uniref:Uncharacterized protein n=1 Tax=Danionella cerebrum TaxID=2873325 RepID=A0A553QB69_9TELE|nr:hypothetical protein DNTS_031717 [Danionella translucida]
MFQNLFEEVTWPRLCVRELQGCNRACVEILFLILLCVFQGCLRYWSRAQCCAATPASCVSPGKVVSPGGSGNSQCVGAGVLVKDGWPRGTLVEWWGSLSPRALPAKSALDPSGTTLTCGDTTARSQGNWTFSAGQGQLKVRKRHGESLKQKITKSCRILPCSYKRPELEGLWKDFRHGAALELIFWLHTCLTSALIFPLILLQGLIPPALAPLPVCSFK